MCVLCIHLFTELGEQMCVKGMYFNVVDNLNPILQNVKFEWHFSANQHFSMDDTVCSLIFRRDLFDPSSETRKLSSYGICSVHACPDTEWPIQFSWYVVIQSARDIPSCTSSWKIYRTKTSIVALLSSSVDSSTWVPYHGDSLILTVAPQYPLLFQGILSIHPFT